MPIFQKKSLTKSIPPRTGRIPQSVCPKREIETSETLKLDLNSGEKELRFVDGIWIQHNPNRHGHASRSNELNVDDMLALKRKMDRVEQENNLLQVKVDILTDLLTEKLCEEAQKL